MAASPLQLIRRECLRCMGVKTDHGGHVEFCESRGCELWRYRMGKMPDLPPRSPLKAIRKFCLECAGGFTEVKECSGGYVNGVKCGLWRFRFGKRPKRGS